VLRRPRTPHHGRLDSPLLLLRSAAAGSYSAGAHAAHLDQRRSCMVLSADGAYSDRNASGAQRRPRSRTGTSGRREAGHPREMTGLRGYCLRLLEDAREVLPCGRCEREDIAMRHALLLAVPHGDSIADVAGLDAVALPAGRAVSKLIRLGAVRVIRSGPDARWRWPGGGGQGGPSRQNVHIGGSARLLGGAIRLWRAMTATGAAGVIGARCAPVTRRSGLGDRGAAGAGLGSVSAAARTVR